MSFLLTCEDLLYLGDGVQSSTRLMLAQVLLPFCTCATATAANARCTLASDVMAAMMASLQAQDLLLAMGVLAPSHKGCELEIPGDDSALCGTLGKAKACAPLCSCIRPLF